MKRKYAILLLCMSLILCVCASCITREAAERQREAAGDVLDTVYHTVTFYQGDVVLTSVQVADGMRVSDIPAGRIWHDEAGAATDPSAVTVTANMAFYCQNATPLQMARVQYLAANVRLFDPEGTVTRAQAAQIICALLDEETVNTAGEGIAYSDVAAGSEYYNSVAAVSALGIMQGYGDGAFRPDEPITRGELIAVMCRMSGIDGVAALAFEDVPADHWAMENVAAAMGRGWISGCEDGNFYPDAPVTRAEMAALLNRLRGRTPNQLAYDFVCEKSPYADVPRDHWAYYDILEASFDNELLPYFLGEVKDLEPGFVLIANEYLCHVNAETLRLDYYEGGFHTIEDGLASDGLYYVPENGYFFNRSSEGLQELDGSMFYTEAADGPFKTDYKLGYLYFAGNGRYTSGDATLDSYVDQIMSPIIDGKTENLLNEDKLREAYNAILYGGYSYAATNQGGPRGSTYWAKSCAKTMYERKRGVCFNWAAAFLFLARRLGYQAYPVCGGAWRTGALHAWVMIDEENEQYIYDVELDWGLSTGGNGRYLYSPGYGSLFKQPRSNPRLPYVFPDGTLAFGPSTQEPAPGEEPDFEDDSPVVMPGVGSAVGTQAYVLVDGAMVYLPTEWSPEYDENGNLTGYTVTAVYDGVTYSSFIPLSGNTNGTEGGTGGDMEGGDDWNDMPEYPGGTPEPMPEPIPDPEPDPDPTPDPNPEPDPDPNPNPDPNPEPDPEPNPDTD